MFVFCVEDAAIHITLELCLLQVRAPSNVEIIFFGNVVSELTKMSLKEYQDLTVEEELNVSGKIQLLTLKVLCNVTWYAPGSKYSFKGTKVIIQ